MQVSDEDEEYIRDDIQQKWREQKLQDLDDPFEWHMLYGEHSAERGGDFKAYEKKVRRNIIIAVSVYAVLVVSVILIQEIPKMVRYNEAIDLMNQGQLEEAQTRFLKMDEYRDSMAYYYCCKAQQDAEKGYYSSAHYDLYMVKQKYHLSASKYPEGLNEKLIEKIETGYDAYIRAESARTLASMKAGSSVSPKTKTTQKKTYTYTKKRSKSTTPPEEDDPLNARSYDNSEDFYDDNYYDFFDYEEAEDYYYEHGGR